MAIAVSASSRTQVRVSSRSVNPAPPSESSRLRRTSWGTKTAFIAPPTVSTYTVLGMVLPTVKMSATTPRPSAAVIAMSRNSPVILLITVPTAIWAPLATRSPCWGAAACWAASLAASGSGEPVRSETSTASAGPASGSPRCRRVRDRVGSSVTGALIRARHPPTPEPRRRERRHLVGSPARGGAGEVPVTGSVGAGGRGGRHGPPRPARGRPARPGPAPGRHWRRPRTPRRAGRAPRTRRPRR